MTVLKLPEQLSGSWEHALFLSYGVNIPFFENTLWRQFRSRCRNKIILADGQRYLEACQNYAQGGVVRHLNQHYVAEGIFTNHAAHAKLILLTNPEKGRLLVGSGNLNWQGYASGGELFTQYDYETDQSDSPEMINPFLAVREFVQLLVERGYVTGTSARKRIDYLFENTSWLYHKPTGDWQPVRHNLDDSFLDQLKQFVGSEKVKKLTVLAPFFDKEAIALTQMIKTFKPKRATVLVQPGRASVDPKALQAVLDEFPNCRVRACKPQEDGTYIHAKLYLLKLPKRTVCLQGSPNLSQVAMLRSARQGNIELANLLSGPHHHFKHLLKGLNIQPATTGLDSLNLSYIAPERSTESTSEEVQLTGGEWHRNLLSIKYRGPTPDLKTASLVVANQIFPLTVRYNEPGQLDIELTPDIIEWLTHPVPISIQWGNGEDALTSNPIFICNRANLNAVLEVSGDDEGEKLPRLGELDLDDTEIEQLLAELDSALIIDRRSVWQIAGRPIPPTTTDDEEALHLSYADIDYEMLRQHPKIAQYMRRGSGGQQYIRSRLQIILNSITDHFRGLLDVSEQTQLVKRIIDSAAETEEEREQEAEEYESRRWSAAKRLQRILKNFIQRYLRGLQSPDFQELAGYEVIVQNYIIFSHLLWRLFAKGWVDNEFIIEALLQTWLFFWGNDTKDGYYQQLTKAQKAQVSQLVQEHHVEAEIMAALTYCAEMTNPANRHSEIEHREELRFTLRDFWQSMLRRAPFEVTAKTLEETWRIMGNLNPYEALSPPRIVDELEKLARFETDYSFLRKIEAEYEYPPHTCTFETVTVRRLSLDREVDVDCLVLCNETALADYETANLILQAWMRFKKLDYYRLAAPDHNGSAKMMLYEVSDGAGVYWARDLGKEPIDFGPVMLETLDWEVNHLKLNKLADQVNASLVLPSAKIRVSS